MYFKVLIKRIQMYTEVFYSFNSINKKNNSHKTMVVPLLSNHFRVISKTTMITDRSLIASCT